MGRYLQVKGPSMPRLCYFQRGCVARTANVAAARSREMKAHGLKLNFPTIGRRISVNSILSIVIGECDLPQPCGSSMSLTW